MKKNQFKWILLIFVTGILATSIFSCQQAPKEKFIGLQLYSVRVDMNEDAKATVAAVGEMGYKFVEAAGYGDGQFYGMQPVEFKDLCEANGLKFLGSHTGMDVPNDTTWDSTMAWWDACIDAHAVAGVKWIVMPWMGRTGYESIEGLRRYCAYFNTVGEKCNAKGIRFGYHNHANEFTTELEGKPVYDWMLELTDADKVMFQLDLYWIIEGGKNPVDYFNAYPGRFENWHIKDKEEVGASGMIDFEAIFAAKEKAGVEYGVVEVEEYNFEPLESCKMSLEFLNTTDYIKL
ncbi:MAG: sugar phosphate isomerase/epimerase [Mariniphaga sp.]|nr:sugar phosphate isomerase/epimerase [Mariniphaga sp.]